MTNEIDWSALSFGYMKTDYNVRCTYRDGKWGELEVSDSEMVSMHMAATVLHYGQAGFEGLKAFRGKDGRIRIFRMDENGKRLLSTSKGIMLAELPLEKFEEAVKLVVKLNERFVPPYGSGASLYIRPVLFGTGPQIGVKPATEFQFIVFVMPVGPYFKEGFKATPVCILRHFDRAAPYGTGRYKVGGNYAASLVAGEEAHAKGYSAVLYLDARQKKFVDECGPANFFGIKNNTYVTPKSESILPSVTNKSLMTLAEAIGMKVEQRQVPEEELSTFVEAGMCGTAAVISPISRIDDLDEGISYIYTDTAAAGPVCETLYNKLRAIQDGDEPDLYGWITIVE